MNATIWTLSVVGILVAVMRIVFVVCDHDWLVDLFMYLR